MSVSEAGTRPDIRPDAGPARPRVGGTDPGTTGTPVLVGLYLCLLVGVPSVYVVGPLGAVGAPAGLVSCLLFGLWALSRLTGPAAGRTTTAVHRLLLVFAAAFAAATVAAALRPMAAVEFSAATRGVVVVCGWLGVALVVTEGLRSRVQLYSLIRLTVGAGSVLALLGFAQFATGFDIVNNLHIPGLTLNSTAVTLYQRAGFARVNATTLHAIEFATVLAMILPLAVGEALRRRTTVAALQALLVAGALPLTVSRSGMLGLAVGLIFTFVIVGRRLRLLLLALLPVGVAGFVAVTPGLLGTIRDLFLAADSDTSISARTDDYPAVVAFFHQAPWLGRGPFTFLPSIYRTLDNQYLGALVEGGLVGLVALVALVAVPVVLALLLMRRVPSGEDRILCAGLAAAFVVAILLFLTFDAFSFPTAMGIFFLLLGVLGAAGRVLPDAAARSASAARPVRRRSAAGVAAAVVAGVAVVGIGGLALATAAPAYEARGSAALAVPAQPGQNIYFGKLETQGVSDLVQRVVDSQRTRDRLRAQGYGHYELALGNGSLAPLTEVHGSGDVLSISATSGNARQAAATAKAVLRAIEDCLRDLQGGRGIDPAVEVAVVESFETPVVTVLPVHPVLGVAALLALAGMAAGTARALVDRRR